RRRNNLKIIQLWHAAGAFKKFGYSTVGTKFGPHPLYLKLVPIHSNYTHVYVSSKNVVHDYAEAFNMHPSRIFSYGVPRIDLLNRKQDMERIKSLIMDDNPLLKNEKKIRVLIAPTYRADGSSTESGLDFTK